MYIFQPNSDISTAFPENSLIEKITFETAQKGLNHRKIDYQFTYNLLAILQESSQQLSLQVAICFCFIVNNF